MRQSDTCGGGPDESRAVTSIAIDGCSLSLCKGTNAQSLWIVSSTPDEGPFEVVGTIRVAAVGRGRLWALGGPLREDLVAHRRTRLRPTNGYLLATRCTTDGWLAVLSASAARGTVRIGYLTERGDMLEFEQIRLSEWMFTDETILYAPL